MYELKTSTQFAEPTGNPQNLGVKSSLDNLGQLADEVVNITRQVEGQLIQCGLMGEENKKAESSIPESIGTLSSIDRTSKMMVNLQDKLHRIRRAVEMLNT